MHEALNDPFVMVMASIMLPLIILVIVMFIFDPMWEKRTSDRPTKSYLPELLHLQARLLVTRDPIKVKIIEVELKELEARMKEENGGK